MSATVTPPPQTKASTAAAQHKTEWETPNDYSLVGERTQEAIQKGYAEADWYQCPVEPAEMRKLLARRNWPAIRDSIFWFGILIGSGAAGFYLWGTWWAIIPFLIYGMIYGGSADSRWHESSHGTAFKTDWMNNVLYEIASFMVMRESTLWRWSHTRHHSDTIIVGRDPEIASPRPPSLLMICLGFIGIPQMLSYVKKVIPHAFGIMHADEQTYVAKDQWNRVYWVARVHLLIYAATLGAAYYYSSLLPLMFVGLPSLYGGWLMPLYGLTQHAGLAENVLDHRLNCRTVNMNIINRFLYWNMNYHIEHHMFPLVPYHNLPKLHALIKDDTPPPYTSIYDAWKEIIPAVLKQRKDPTYFVDRPLPEPKQEAKRAQTYVSADPQQLAGWISVCDALDILPESVVRFDHAEKTFAIYRNAEGNLFATSGICTHGKVHLSEGLVKGQQVECPKHNGRFDIRDGLPQRKPVCKGLKTFSVKEEGGQVLLNLS